MPPPARDREVRDHGVVAIFDEHVVAARPVGIHLEPVVGQQDVDPRLRGALLEQPPVSDLSVLFFFWRHGQNGMSSGDSTAGFSLRESDTPVDRGWALVGADCGGSFFAGAGVASLRMIHLLAFQSQPTAPGGRWSTVGAGLRGGCSGAVIIRRPSSSCSMLAAPTVAGLATAGAGFRRTTAVTLGIPLNPMMLVMRRPSLTRSGRSVGCSGGCRGRR